MSILNINSCVGLIIDFFNFKTIFISFLMIGNLLSFYLFICEIFSNSVSVLSMSKQLFYLINER